MPMTLQEAIDFAADPRPPNLFGFEVFIAISMHDEAAMCWPVPIDHCAARWALTSGVGPESARCA